MAAASCATPPYCNASFGCDATSGCDSLSISPGFGGLELSLSDVVATGPGLPFLPLAPFARLFPLTPLPLSAFSCRDFCFSWSLSTLAASVRISPVCAWTRRLFWRAFRRADNLFIHFRRDDTSNCSHQKSSWRRIMVG